MLDPETEMQNADGEGAARIVLWRIRRCYSHYEMKYMEEIHEDEIHKMVIAG